MMNWHGSGAMSGWGWTLSMIGMSALCGVLIAVGIVWYLRRPSIGLTRPSADGAQPHSERILAARYARGEMDESEYSTRLTTLRQAEHDEHDEYGEHNQHQ